MFLNFNDPKLDHDRVLIVDGRKFCVVSEILCTKSEYFSCLFSETQVSEIVIDNIQADLFEKFLEIIYGNDLIHFTDNLIIPLLDISYRFMVPTAQTFCIQYIDKNFDRLDYIKLELLDKAYVHGIDVLKKKVLDQLVKHPESFNLIELLKLAFQHNVDDLKKSLRSYIYTAKREEEWNRCLECPNRIQQRECTHTEMYSQPMSHNSIIAKNIDEIVKLSEEIKTFVLVSSISYC